MLRLFIGLSMGQDQRIFFKRLQDQGKSYYEKGKWTSPSNFHLTLCFLGLRPPASLTEIQKVMDKVASQTRPFTMTFDHLDTFTKKKGLILWAGLGAGKEKVSHLAHQLHQGLEEVGLMEPVEDYRPHLTLARQVRGGDFAPSFTLTQEVTELILYESKQVEGQLTYQAIKRSPLKKADV